MEAEKTRHGADAASDTSSVDEFAGKFITKKKPRSTYKGKPVKSHDERKA